VIQLKKMLAEKIRASSLEVALGYSKMVKRPSKSTDNSIHHETMDNFYHNVHFDKVNKLQQQLKNNKMFMNMVIHDMRNPTNAI
jgi:hypothetical protein